MEDIGLGDEDDGDERGDGMDIDEEEIPKRLDKLVEMYSYTMSSRDLRILAAIHRADPTLNSLVFKLLDAQLNATNETLSKQATIADFVSLKLNDQMLAESVLNFALDRKLDNLSDLDGLAEMSSAVYDPVYLLPNIYNLLDYGNHLDLKTINLSHQ